MKDTIIEILSAHASDGYNETVVVIPESSFDEIANEIILASSPEFDDAEDVHEVWLYVWKACRNHNKENPSNSDYLLINIEDHFSIKEYKKMSKDKKRDAFDDIARSWSESVDQDGYYHGYEYGSEVKTPTKEWIEKKLSDYNRRIQSMHKRMANVKKYLHG